MTYNFKDLMALGPEAIGNGTEYRDYTNINESDIPAELKGLAPDQPTAKLATWILEKGIGKDVRLALALAVQWMNVLASEAKQVAERTQARQDNLEDQTASDVAQMEAEKNAVIANATVDSEVILARGGKPTLQARLDETTTDYLTLNRGLVNAVDISTELDLLVEKCQNENKGLYIPNGVFNLTQDVRIHDVKNIKIDGEIVVADGKMLWISGKRYLESYDVFIRKIRGKVRLSGFFESSFKILAADELELYANRDLSFDDEAIAYSNFTLGRIEHLKIFSEGSQIAWINENVFTGGRIFKFSMGGNYQHNNNTFYKAMFENTLFEIDNGALNNFYDARLEGNNQFTFNENAVGNKVYQVWQINKEGGIYDTNLHGTQDFIEFGVGNDIVSRVSQHEKTHSIIHLNKNTKNIPHNAIKKDPDLKIRVEWLPIVQSSVVPLKKSFGVNYTSNQSLFRIFIKLYDIGMNEIQDDSVVRGNAVSYNQNEYRYQQGANNMDGRVEIRKRENSPVEYVSIQILGGGGTTNATFDFLNVDLTTDFSSDISEIVESMRVFNGVTKYETLSNGYYQELPSGFKTFYTTNSRGKISDDGSGYSASNLSGLYYKWFDLPVTPIGIISNVSVVTSRVGGSDLETEMIFGGLDSAKTQFRMFRTSNSAIGKSDLTLKIEGR